MSDEQQRQIRRGVRAAAGSPALRRQSCPSQSQPPRGCGGGRDVHAQSSRRPASAADADRGGRREFAKEIVDDSPSERRSYSCEREGERLAIHGWVVRVEMLGCPMALEHHPHAIDHMDGIHRGQPDVPLQSVE